MSNPVDTATQQEEQTLTVEQQVTSYANQMRKDENYKLPEEVESNELFKTAVTAEKRRLDTVASFTKSQQALKVAEAERAELLAKSKVGLTSEQVAELEELKYTDAEAYYDKRKEFEKANKKEFKDNLDSVANTISAEEEVERRTELISEFEATHNIKIDDDFVENELPAKLLKQLEDGTYNFEQFLVKVADYINKPIKTTTHTKQIDLSKEAGSQTPSHDEKSVKETTASQWSKTTF